MHHVTHAHQSRHTYKWVLSQKCAKLSSCFTILVMSHRLSHTHGWVTHMDESHTWMSHTHEWVDSWIKSHIWISHITHKSQSVLLMCTMCCFYLAPRVMSHTWMSQITQIHVTHMNESSVSLYAVCSNLPLKMLHLQNPPNRETQISRHLAVIQVSRFERGLWGVAIFFWKLSYFKWFDHTDACHTYERVISLDECNVLFGIVISHRFMTHMMSHIWTSHLSQCMQCVISPYNTLHTSGGSHMNLASSYHTDSDMWHEQIHDTHDVTYMN